MAKSKSVKKPKSAPRVPPGLEWSADTDCVTLVRPKRLTAGAWTEALLAITVEDRPLAEGERLGLGVPYGFPRPVANDPTAEGYLTAHGPEGVVLSVAPMEGWEHFVWIAVEKGTLAPGATVTIFYGDRSAGSPGVRVPRQALSEMLWPCFRESARAALLPASPRVTVEAGALASLRVHLPGVAWGGERVRVRVAAQDAFGNRPPVSGRVAFENRAAARGLPESIPLVRGLGEAEFETPDFGLVRLAAREEKSGAGGVSNPMEVARGGGRLWFGDIHVHTEISYDAGGSLEEMYEYARDTAGLDFAAASDHQTALDGVEAVCRHPGGIPGARFESMPERWRATCEAARRFNEPGRFVTFAAFEMSPSEFRGHRNVYWLEDEPEMLRVERGEPGYLAGTPLADLARAKRVLVVPHHPPIMWKPGVWESNKELGNNGLVYGDLPDAVQPVVEMYSKHGTSERLDNERPLQGQIKGHFAQDFLEAGHRFGFIGGSDTHLANPGSPLREGPYATLRFRAGLAAVWAPELTREALWDAIRARRCYATTGPRIGLRFSVSDLVMGEEGAVRGARTVRLEAHGEAPLIWMEIVKNARVVAQWTAHRSRSDAALEWEDAAGAEREVDWYYARVRQHDGEYAWSSPVWVRR